MDEPIIKVSAESKKKNVPIVTPEIGEIVELENTNASKEWWVGIA